MGITLYKNADWILTMNEKREKFRHGDLLISGKEILDVGNDLEKKYAGKLQIGMLTSVEASETPTRSYIINMSEQEENAANDKEIENKIMSEVIDTVIDDLTGTKEK